MVALCIVGALSAVGYSSYFRQVQRTKVSRVQMELRTASQAIGSYFVDHNRFPEDPSNHGILPSTLTTPIAYLGFGSIADPLAGTSRAGLEHDQNRLYRFWYVGDPEWLAQQRPEEAEFYGIHHRNHGRWMVYARGPYGQGLEDIPGSGRRMMILYDPTNGIESVGRVFVSSRKAGWD